MKKRVISAVIALAIVIPLFLIGGIPYRLLIALLAAQAFKETLDLKNSHHPYPGIIAGMALLGTELLVLINNNGSYIYTGFSMLAASLIFLCLLIPTIFDDKNKYTTRDAFYLIGTMLLIGIFFSSFIQMVFSKAFFREPCCRIAFSTFERTSPSTIFLTSFSSSDSRLFRTTYFTSSSTLIAP